MSDEWQALGDLERAVLQHLVDAGPMTAAAAAAHFAASAGYARTTILTVLERLRAKGFLTRRKSGQHYRYAARVNSHELTDGLIGHFVETVLGGAVSPLVTFLSRSRRLTSDEAEALRRWIDQQEPSEDLPDV